MISPDHLVELGLLEACDLSDCPVTDEQRVDYGTIIPWKNAILKKAYENYLHTSDKMLLEEYDSFYENNQFWLDDYALFMACKDAHNGAPWTEWEKEYRTPSSAFLATLRTKLKTSIRYYYFVQFIFSKNGTN